jgi:AcrR family transcriptional regulator
MSRPVSIFAEPTKRQLSSRQIATVAALTQATVDELRETTYDGLTVRNVARRAGVAPATAYTYFGSREHLVTEVFWRRMQALPETRIDRRRSWASQITAVLSDLTLLVADEPELASACTQAMLATDPDVKVLRDRIGAEMRRRILTALGDDADPTVLGTLELAMIGAMVQAGMGHVEYADLPTLLADVVTLVIGPMQ